MVAVNAPCRERTQTVLDRCPLGGTVLQIGMLIGQMDYWAKKQRPDLNWISVDNWLPISQQPQHYIDTKDDHALHDSARAEENRMEAYEAAKQGGSSILYMSSPQASMLIRDHSIDVVFIDGDHSYDGCLLDIQVWTRKVRPKGWIGGHDYLNPDLRFQGVDKAVLESFDSRDIECDNNYTWWVRL